MAKKTTASKTVNYRKCVIPSDQGRDLQQLLSAALLSFPKPGERFEPLNSASSELRCIGMHFNKNSCLCGYLTSYERGASQPVISDDPTAAKLRLSALAPPAPKKGDAPQQYIPGVLYFVIFKNHVAFVSTHAMRSSSLESHLNWLLKSKTKELPATVPFSLSDEAQKVTKEKIRNSHVKAIAFGQSLMTEVNVTSSPNNEVSDTKQSTSNRKKAKSGFLPEGPMLSLIKDLFNDENKFEKLGLDEIFDGNLEVWIEIRYPKFTRSKSEDAVKLMDTLGVALRDIEGDQVVLELANGHKVSGKDLKISGSIEATVLDNKLPDEETLLDQMITWLREQINNGVIDH